MLSLPPAFVLSQDQTLKLKAACAAILDVRTSAHPSNPAKDLMSLCLMCSRFLKETRSRQTVKLTSHHRPKPSETIYRRLIHRMNQTALISLQYLSISKSVETKSSGGATLLGSATASGISGSPSFKSLKSTAPSVPSAAPSAHQRVR